MALYDAFYGGDSGVGASSAPDTVSAPAISAGGSYSQSASGSFSASGAPALWAIGLVALAFILLHLE